MKKTKKIISKMNNRELLNKNDWFDEHTSVEKAFYYECALLWKERPNDLIDLLHNRKKRLLNMERHKKVNYKKINQTEMKDVITQFFESLTLERLALEMEFLADGLYYKVEEHVGYYEFGLVDKESQECKPFKLEDFKNDKLTIIDEDGNEMNIAIQSMVCFFTSNDFIDRIDTKRILKCKSPKKELTFSYSYSYFLKQDNLENFFIFPRISPINSYVIATIVYTKAIRFINDCLNSGELQDDVEFSFELINEMERLEERKVEVLNTCQLQAQNKVIQRLTRKEQNIIQKQQELERKLEKQNEKLNLQVEKNKELTDRLKDLNKQEMNQLKMERQLIEEHQQYKVANMELKERIKELEKNLDKEQKVFNRKLKESEDTIKGLRQEVGSVQQQLNVEKRKTIQNEEVTFEEWLAKGPSYFQKLSITQEKKLEDFLHLASEQLEEKRKLRPKYALTTNRVGYCIIRENGHYIKVGDEEILLRDLPDDIYLCDHQFVEVTKDNEYARRLNYFYENGPADKSIKHFVIVTERHQQAFIKINGETFPIMLKDGVQIRDGQVIAINQNYEFVSYYHMKNITLDDFFLSIRLKGHTPSYVELELTNGYVVRDLSNNRSFLPKSDNLGSRSFIIMNREGKAIYKDFSGIVLKKSSFYKEKQLASVTEIEEEIFVLKQNGEYVLLQKCLPNIELELGDVIWIDEHNEMIELVVEEEYIVTATIEQKLLEAGRRVKRNSNKKEEIDKIYKLLIIGNVRLSERYKKFFGESGYEVEVVDGTGPFEKIRQSCNKYPYILYSTSFTSHKNSGKIKIECAKAPIILCDSTKPAVMLRRLVEATS